MVYVNHIDTDVICFEDNDQLKDIKINWVKMFDKCVYQKVKRLFITLDKEKEMARLINYGNNKITGQRLLF